MREWPAYHALAPFDGGCQYKTTIVHEWVKLKKHISSLNQSIVHFAGRDPLKSIDTLIKHVTGLDHMLGYYDSKKHNGKTQKPNSRVLWYQCTVLN